MISPIQSQNLQPAPDAAVEFLEKLRPQGPWLLWSLNPETGEQPCHLFGPESKADLARSVAKVNTSGFNAYYHVNLTPDGFERRASEADILGCPYLHVDLDPRNGEPLEAERARILDQLQNPPSGVPKPTAIIDSGNGFQALWKLDSPLSQNEAKARNKWLADRLGGDACQNVDRVLRLPGTINWPNEQKRKKGRVPSLASLVNWSEESVYSAEAFGTSGLAEVQWSTDTELVPEYVDALDELGLPPDLQQLIEEGDARSRFESRSELVYSVVARLGDHDLPQEMILGILLDDRFAVSERQLGKPNPLAFASNEVKRILAKTRLLWELHSVDGDKIPLPANDNPAPGRRCSIEMRPGSLSETVTQAETALLETGAPIYQRGGMLVRIASDASGGINLVPVEEHWLRERMADSAVWFAPMKDGWKERDPNAQYVKTLLARRGEWRFPHLHGVVRTPIVMADGRVLSKPGYDPESGLYLDLGYTEFPPIPEAPSYEDAHHARAEIKHILRGFAFIDETALAVAVSAILTGLLRRILPAAPMHAIDAPTAGTGKSLLAEVVGILVSGETPAMLSQGKNHEEDEKRLGTVLMTGDPLIVIDNCERMIQGDLLCSMLTQEKVQLRILGRSERVQLPTNTLMMATGNNLDFAGDVTRRVVVCRLDAGCERPDQRCFDFDPRKKALAERGRLRTPLLDLGAARLAGRVAGQPPLARLKELLRPGIVQARGDPLAPAELGNALLAAQPLQHDPDLLLGRMVLARPAADVLHDLFGRRLRWSGFLSHLHSLAVTMSQKSSVEQSHQNGPQALTRDNHRYFEGNEIGTR